MLCYISRNYRNTDTAGNKAKTDMETLMAARGMRNIGIRTTSFTSKPVEFILNLIGVLKALAVMRKGDTVVLQYPVKKYYSLVCRIAKLRGVGTVTLIHDLGSCRRRKLTEAKEIKRLSHTSCIIALNDRMARWLKERGCTVPVTTLEMWDYLSDAVMPRREWPLYEIAYAGGLAHRKNEFLYKWKPGEDGYVVNLYGSGFESENAAGKSSIRPMGFVKSDELISTCKGSFGLVWDGDSLEECSGHFGRYLMLNNPHKVSLYIRCGLPVLIWDKAAMAPVIEKTGTGILLGSINDIGRILRDMTPERYAELAGNAARLSKKMAGGYFFNSALDRALAIINSREK